MTFLKKYFAFFAIASSIFTLYEVNTCKVERWNGTKTNMLFIEKSIFLLTNIIVSPIITPIYIIYYYAYNLEISLRKENIDNYIDSKNPTKMFNFKIIRK